MLVAGSYGGILWGVCLNTSEVGECWHIDDLSNNAKNTLRQANRERKKKENKICSHKHYICIIPVDII